MLTSFVSCQIAASTLLLCKSVHYLPAEGAVRITGNFVGAAQAYLHGLYGQEASLSCLLL
jgi:hypothetical protein